jgi:hypothetical protein
VLAHSPLLVQNISSGARVVREHRIERFSHRLAGHFYGREGNVALKGIREAYSRHSSLRDQDALINDAGDVGHENVGLAGILDSPHQHDEDIATAAR